MRAVGAVAALAATLTSWCGEVEAYRPFDGTDAAVAYGYGRGDGILHYCRKQPHTRAAANGAMCDGDVAFR